MNSSTAVLMSATIAAAVFATPVATLAQSETARTVEQFTCKDLMRESGASRDRAIAFLHGYVLGKSGSSEFDVEILADQTDAFVDYCLDNPGDGALESMIKVKN